MQNGRDGGNRYDMADKDINGKKAKADERAARLAENLRANLRLRKQQARYAKAGTNTVNTDEA